MNHLPIVSQAREYVTKYLQEHPNKNVIYHTLQHTEAVVDVTKQLIIHYELGNHDTLITLIAAWFIDTGYYDDYRQHEVASAQIAEKFLRTATVSEGIIQEIKSCLLATKMPQIPATLPQEIICDAVFFHLAAADFGVQNKLIRKEQSLLQGASIDKDEWRKSTLQFLERHTYFTDYCKKNFGKRKKENLEKLKRKDAALSPPVDPVAKPANVSNELLFFAETGHTLRGATLRYWNKFGGLAQFGFPLTEEFVETSESDGKEYTVQYFERARFEAHPAHRAPEDVLLGLLGRQLYQE
jgi:predicted metal-dependent HD superfamily phosphohydrolase